MPSAVLAVAIVIAMLAPLARAQGSSPFVEHALAGVPPGVEIQGSITFAPDGSQVAYVGSVKGRPVPVIGSKAFDAYWFVDGPRFGAGGRVAFRVMNRSGKRALRCWVLLDGKRTAPNDGIDQLAWSPDGLKLAYWTRPGSEIAEDGSCRGGDMVLVVDGRTGAKWRDAPTLSPPRWSADSNHVLTIASNPPKAYLLLDDKPFLEGVAFNGPIFSPDGKRIACAIVRPPSPEDGTATGIQDGSRWFVACGALRLGLDFDSAASPVFSPDGARIAFKAAKGGRVGVAVDETVAMLDWDFVSEPVFSPDGTHLAFAASKGCTFPPMLLVLREGDGHVKGGRWQLVLDGTPTGETYEAMTDVTFSPDSRRIAFRALCGTKWRIVCGTQMSVEFDFVGPPRFSPDSSRVAFGVLKGREFAWTVLSLE